MMMVKGLITRYFGHKSTLALSSHHIETAILCSHYGIKSSLAPFISLISLIPAVNISISLLFTSTSMSIQS